MRIPFRLLLASLVCFSALLGLAQAQENYILIDGSSTVYPVMKLASEDYGKQLDSRVIRKVEFSGTTGGFRKFLSAEVDVTGASRPITREEIMAAKKYDIPFIEIPIAYDALTIAVHPEATWVDSIKVSELKKMWERKAQGAVTKWSQIRPEWPDQEFKLYGAGADSGTYDYFSEVVVGGKEGLRSDYVGSEDDEVLVRGIEQDRNALGFVPYAYFTKAGAKLKALAVQWDFNAKSGLPVQGVPASLPSEDAVLRGTYMPFGRPLFVYVAVKSLEAKPHLKEFLQNLLINADDYVAQVHYLSLPKISYARSIADLETKRIGTRFYGEAEVGLSVYEMINRRAR